ncbi:MAG: ribonuclease Y [Verrucomicrobia bacterium]|nr:MAG: ribonuclease Y [Verrucomicrobiota bacterium]
MVMLFPWHGILSFLGGGISIGLVIWYFLRKKVDECEQKAKARVKIAKKEALCEVKEQELRFTEALEKERDIVESRYGNLMRDLAKREEELQESLQKFQMEKDIVEDKALEVERVKGELNRKKYNLDNLRLLYRRRLLQITEMNESEARVMLKDEIASECIDEVRQIRRDILGRSLEDIEGEANRIMIDVMQRLSSVPSTNMSAALIKLPNEDIKGRLIGKEGRNIKSFESETGTTLLIDDTPGTVLVSSFDPVRREVARLSLIALIQDGRIHPASIEEIVQQTKVRVEKEILLQGEKAVSKLNLKGINQEIISLLGRLYYKLSNNQNTLEHSIEVAYLCSMLASELGMDPYIAKRCGLFHDLGKAIDCESEGSHAEAAAQLLKRNGEDARVINAVEASHDEVPSISVYAELLKIADRISATRPGARCDSGDGYVQRIKSLEDIAKTFDGIEDVYAIQAGREIRVVVAPEKYEPYEAQALAVKIRQRIEEEISFPGKIKVMVIREERFVDTAQ